MIEKSMKNIRQEFKKNGIYYTPPELAEKLYSYVDVEVHSAYDPTCGVGNLLRVFPSHVMKYGQELDAEQLGLVDIPNFIGYAGDTLKKDGFMGMKFDCIVANPPFSVKWTPEELKEDVRFKGLPLPPPSKADWAFILHILHHLSDEGVAVILEFPGILYRGQKEYQVRKWFVENNYIDRVVHVPGDVFEDTKICTCILVLRKNKKTTDITFENEKHTITVPLQEVVDNDYTLSVNTYIQEERQVEEINIDDINRQVVVQLLRKVDSTIKNLTELRKTFPNDNFYLTELLEGLKEIILISEVQTVSEIKLLPCPFCGGEAKVINESECGFEYYGVMCFKCGTGTRLTGIEPVAIDLWNTRKPMEQIVERLEELEDLTLDQYNRSMAGTYEHDFADGATMALNRGMPIEQVQQLLGHESIDTTTIYAISTQESVKANHKKYVS